MLGARELHLGQKAAALLGKDDGRDRSVPMVPAFFQVCWDHQAETGPQEAAECQMGSAEGQTPSQPRLAMLGLVAPCLYQQG